MQQPAWQEPDFLRLQVQQDQDSYLSKLTSFLAANPPALPAGGPGSFGSLSSPESAGSSPSSNSDSSSGNPTTTAAPQRPANSIPVTTNDKRKTQDESTEGALKDRRSSSSTNLNEGLHSHPDADDDEDNEDGKKGGKTSERRRAQNRQAQRAFRERKEKHLKELEDRVFSLEQQSNDQATENSALKELLSRLQSENERLKVFETAFSFSYAKDVSNSSSMPQSAQFGGKPPTPPTVQDEIDDLSAFTVPTFDANNSPPVANSTSMFSGSLFSPANSSDLSTAPTSNHASNNASPVGAFDDAFFSFKSLSAPSPSSTVESSISSSSNNLNTPPDLSSDLFSAYRDTSSFGNAGTNDFSNSLTDLDSFFGNSTMDSTDFSNFLVSPSPPDVAKQQESQKTSPVDSTHSIISPNAACPYTKGEKFTFDVDGLCSEMKAKATCKEAARQALQDAMKEDSNSLKTIFPGSI